MLKIASDKRVHYPSILLALLPAVLGREDALDLIRQLLCGFVRQAEMSGSVHGSLVREAVQRNASESDPPTHLARESPSQTLLEAEASYG